MKRKVITNTMTILLALAFTLVSVPASSAQPNKPLRCEVYLEFDWGLFQWVGTVTGDIEGDITVTLSEARFPGTTEHFFETWVIVTSDGVIEGFDRGVWSFKTYKARSNGKVTCATGDWAYLVGCNVRFRGETSPFPAEEVTAEIKMEISINDK